MVDRVDGSITVLDLFCGAGGFSLGLTLSSDNFEVVGGIDKDHDSVETFKTNHQTTGLVADISDTRPHYVEKSIDRNEIDLIIGGPPCKGFSSIRPNRSSDEIDYRNYLYKDYFRFVEHFNPEMFVMENVPEIINHSINGDKVLEMILSEVEKLGYNYEWQLLNAAYYGVPQTRTRFILIGSKTGEIQFPKPTHRFTDKSIEKKRIRYKEDTVQPKKNVELHKVVTTTEAISDLPYIKSGETGENYSSRPKNKFQKRMRGYKSGLLSGRDLTHHTATNHSDDIIAALRPGAFRREDIPEDVRPPTGYSSTYSRLYPDEPSTTLTTEYTTAGASRCVHPNENVPRALTVREGMRIQSFPDWVAFCGSKTSVTNQVGNAVPPLLSKAIGDAILQKDT